jgi:hypothetical protein
LIAGTGHWEITTLFSGNDRIANILTIDFESWIHAYTPDGSSSSKRKQLDGGFALSAGRELLDILDRYSLKATIFLVSEIWEWYPEMIDEMKSRGHELAVHSHTHKPLLSGDDVRHELEQSGDFMRTYDVRGFRAPRGIFKKEYMPILHDHNIQYDSSSYGTLMSSSTIDDVLEIPISAWSYTQSGRMRFHYGPLGYGVLKHVFPFASPFMLGIIGTSSIRCVRFENNRNRPVVIAIHLWQIIHPNAYFKFLSWFLKHEVLSLPYCLKRPGILKMLSETSRVITMRQLYDRHLEK